MTSPRELALAATLEQLEKHGPELKGQPNR